jgi:hypothetical protein
MENCMRLNRKDLVGGPGGVRTLDLMTASSCSDVAGKEDKRLNSAKPGKVRQNPQPRRNPDPSPIPQPNDGGENGGKV